MVVCTRWTDAIWTGGVRGTPPPLAHPHRDDSFRPTSGDRPMRLDLRATTPTAAV